MNTLTILVIWMMVILLTLAAAPALAVSHVEMSGWGNLRGVRIDGELVEVTTAIAIATPGWKESAQTAHWRTRRSTYERQGDAIVCGGEISIGRGPALTFRQTLHGENLDIELTSQSDMELEGVFLFVKVPVSQFGAGEGQLVGIEAPRARFATTRPASEKHYTAGVASGAKFMAPKRSVEVAFDRPRLAIFQDGRADKENFVTLFFALHDGNLKSQQTVRSRVTIKATCDVDHSPATVTIDRSQPGPAFAGMGGNFCWGTNSPTVPWYLDNARIAWGRVSFPMQLWHPLENGDPTTQPTDALPEEIRECLRMARELHRRKVPMMIAIWNAPDWALLPGGNRRSRKIKPEKWDAVAKSIGDYLLLFKREVGVEPELFSFNESNLGINVLMSPEEHRDMLKRLGAHFDSLGLKTKMLLGDANEPRAVDYVSAALDDGGAMKYVGMVSYHSWNGGTDEQLIGWRDHARRAGVPLTVAEAGTDPDAHQYRNILVEPWYAVEEIENNLRCLNLSQAISILHWQLTPDYGFVGGGTEGDPITPTRRWWQFKQLADLSPVNTTIYPTKSDHASITAAVVGDVIHISNIGAARPLIINAAGRYRCYVTDVSRGLTEIEAIESRDGKLELNLPAQSYLTLVPSTP